VVASPQAAEGIRAAAGRDYWLAPDEAAFAAAVLERLRTGDRNPQARAGILARYDWGRNLAALDPLFDAPPSARPVLEICPA